MILCVYDGCCYGTPSKCTSLFSPIRFQSQERNHRKVFRCCFNHYYCPSLWYCVSKSPIKCIVIYRSGQQLQHYKIISSAHESNCLLLKIWPVAKLKYELKPRFPCAITCSENKSLTHVPSRIEMYPLFLLVVVVIEANPNHEILSWT